MRIVFKGACALAAAAALAVPATASAASNEVVLDWYGSTAQELNQAAGIQKQEPRARLEQAMVQGAVYDAVNAIARTNQPYLVSPRSRRWFSQNAAAATAAYRVVIDLLPERRSVFDQQYEQSLAGIAPGAAKRGGIRVGRRAARAMLAAREDDGRDGTRAPVFGTEPGVWRPTPPDFAVADTAWVADVTPFLIDDPEDLRTRGPNPLSSKAYARDFNETKELGELDSATRTEDQTDTALYWNLAPWGEIIVSLARSRRLDANDTARYLAMISLAGADAEITVVDEKQYWNTWRPITAIREADTEDNPATAPDPDWEPLIVTPGFPEYPAGHTTGSGAIVGTLQAFFGTDKMTFSASSPGSNTTRGFTRFSQALDEVVDSRVWGGIHWRWADEVGARLGKRIARIGAERYFKPLRRPD